MDLLRDLRDREDDARGRVDVAARVQEARESKERDEGTDEEGTRVNCAMQKTARSSHLRLVGGGEEVWSSSATMVGVGDLKTGRGGQ